MRPAELRVTVLTTGLSVCLAACGSAATGSVSAPAAGKVAHWTAFVHVKRPLDVAGPRRDGSVILAAAGRLALLRATGSVAPFATAYKSPGGGEPYIAMPAPGHKGCSFPAAVYALRLPSPKGVSAIGLQGHVRRLASLSASGLENGIAFDETGRFGYRLLVTVNAGAHTTVDAINCHGVVKTITATAPRGEGGIAVAPSTFGRFAGDLIVPDEISGRIFAVTPSGKSVLVAGSGLPHGQDVGVESEVFIPRLRRFEALMPDRLTPGNPHPGDDTVLGLSATKLSSAGVQPGDLLVGTEGGARADAIRCGMKRCQVQHVADGPSIAHGEGHIAILAR